MDNEHAPSSSIRFTNDIDDLLAFQRYCYARSPAIRRRIAAMTWGGSLVMLVCLPVIQGVASAGAHMIITIGPALPT